MSDKLKNKFARKFKATKEKGYPVTKEITKLQEYNKTKNAKILSTKLQLNDWKPIWKGEGWTLRKDNIIITIPFSSFGRYRIYVLDNNRNKEYKQWLFNRGCISPFGSWDNIYLNNECIYESFRQSRFIKKLKELTREE